MISSQTCMRISARIQITFLDRIQRHFSVFFKSLDATKEFRSLHPDVCLSFPSTISLLLLCQLAISGRVLSHDPGPSQGFFLFISLLTVLVPWSEPGFPEMSFVKHRTQSPLFSCPVESSRCVLEQFQNIVIVLISVGFMWKGLACYHIQLY